MAKKNPSHPTGNDADRAKAQAKVAANKVLAAHAEVPVNDGEILPESLTAGEDDDSDTNSIFAEDERN